MHLSPAHKDAAIRLLDRPADDEPVAESDDNIRRIKTTAGDAAGARTVGDGLETRLRPKPEFSDLK